MALPPPLYAAPLTTSRQCWGIYPHKPRAHSPLQPSRILPVSHRVPNSLQHTLDRELGILFPQTASCSGRNTARSSESYFPKSIYLSVSITRRKRLTNNWRTIFVSSLLRGAARRSVGRSILPVSPSLRTSLLPLNALSSSSRSCGGAVLNERVWPGLAWPGPYRRVASRRPRTGPSYLSF